MEQVEREAQSVIDVFAAEHKAEVVAAFYLRLRGAKVPVAACLDFTMAEFYAIWDDDLEE